MPRRTDGGRNGSEGAPSATRRQRKTRRRPRSRRSERQPSATRAVGGGARSASVLVLTACHEQAELLDGGRLPVAFARNAALVHHGDPVGEGENLVEVLADEQHADSRRGRLA